MSAGADSQALAPRPDAALGPTGPAVPAEEVALGGTSIGPGDLWRIIKQRKVLVLVTFVILYALVGAATVVTYLFFPAYPAEAVLEMSPPRQGAFEVEDRLVHPDIMRQMLETESRKLKQLNLLNRVLSKPEIKQTYFYKWYQGDHQECLFDLQEMVRSSPIPDSNLIQVRLACRYPDESRLIVNTICDEFLNVYTDQSKESTRAKADDLKKALAQQKTELDARLSELKAFRDRTNVPALETERNVVSDNIAYLTNQLTQLEAEAADYESQLRQYEGVDIRQLPITPEIRVLIDADPILRYARERVETMDIELEAMDVAGMLGTEHRQRIIMLARRDGYARKEVARREELIDTLRTRQVDALRQNMSRMRSIMAGLQDRLKEAQAKERDLDRNIQAYQTMVDQYEAQKESVAKLEDAALAADVAIQDRGRILMRLVQRAEKAIEPSRPDPVFYLGGGFLIALLGALGLAFLREFTDKAIRTPVDVARHARLSVLGCIPLLDEDETDVERIELATRQAPHSLVAEAFRQVRTNLLFSGPLEAQRCLLITSPGPEDGKSTVAINLAVTLAHSQERVLLVDCNFRRPAIRGAFDHTRPDGLSNILIGQGRLEELVTRTELPNLDVLTSGPMPPTPAELLGGRYMRELLRQAVQNYDRVIFDGPPVLLMSDALVVSKQVDGVILVSRAVTNTKGALRRAREQLHKIHARVVGAILNGVRAQAGGYFKAQYREFYDYTSDETVPPALPEAPAELPGELGQIEDPDDSR